VFLSTRQSDGNDAAAVAPIVKSSVTVSPGAMLMATAVATLKKTIKEHAESVRIEPPEQRLRLNETRRN
jgi:hypothetical protein